MTPASTPVARNLHPPRRALRTAFIAAVVGFSLALPIAWVMSWMS